MLVTGYIEECNPAKFSASIVSPLNRTMGGTTNKVEKMKGCAWVHVEGMTCGKCVNYIETKMMSVVGVMNIKVSLEEKEARIEFDRLVTTGEEIATVQCTLDIRNMFCAYRGHDMPVMCAQYYRES